MDFFIKYKYYFLGLFIYSIVICSLTIFLGWQLKPTDNVVKETNFVKQEIAIASEPTTECMVDIKGAVKKPGVYKIPCQKIINDAITLAGGIKSEGTTTNINLSKQISNEMVIRIFNKKDLTRALETTAICQTNEIIISSCDEASIIENKPTETPLEPSNNEADEAITTLISINKADLTTLMTLPGIGEAKATSIIKYRNETGLFTKIEEIMNVSGIGEAIFAQIKALITI